MLRAKFHHMITEITNSCSSYPDMKMIRFSKQWQIQRTFVRATNYMTLFLHNSIASYSFFFFLLLVDGFGGHIFRNWIL